MGSGHQSDRDRFMAVFKINLVMFVAELLAGLYSGSLSMVSDSLHLSLHILVSLIAVASEYRFLGFSSANIKFWTAVINISLFFPLAFVIAYEANERLENPPILDLTSLFFIVAIAGLIANIYTIKILHTGHEEKHSENKNRLYLYIHMLVDALGSIIVIAGGALISLTGLYLVDPIASFMLAGLILMGAVMMLWKLFRGHECDHIH